MISILFVGQSYAQVFDNRKKDIKIKHVPDDAMRTLNTKYGSSVIANWKCERGDYYALFKIDKVDYEAKFSSDGGWLETSTQINEADLPSAVHEAIFNGNYQSWKKVDFIFIQRGTGESIYRASVIKNYREREVLITPNGSIIDFENL